MNQSVVLVDIDDTISQTQRVLLEHVNKVSSQKYLFDELTRKFREDKRSEYDQLVQPILEQADIILQTAPYIDALEGMKKLKHAGYDIHIASSRKENLHETTKDWLKLHGFIDFVSRIHPRSSEQKGNMFKISAAKTVGARAAFDDTLEVVNALADVVPVVYLIDQPWNRDSGELPPNVTRVKSFSNGVDIFLQR